MTAAPPLEANADLAMARSLLGKSLFCIEWKLATFKLADNSWQRILVPLTAIPCNNTGKQSMDLGNGG
jgi:hypothetical protein